MAGMRAPRAIALENLSVSMRQSPSSIWMQSRLEAPVFFFRTKLLWLCINLMYYQNSYILMWYRPDTEHLSMRKSCNTRCGPCNGVALFLEEKKNRLFLVIPGKTYDVYGGKSDVYFRDPELCGGWIAGLQQIHTGIQFNKKSTWKLYIACERGCANPNHMHLKRIAIGFQTTPKSMWTDTNITPPAVLCGGRPFHSRAPLIESCEHWHGGMAMFLICAHCAQDQYFDMI